MSDKIQTVILRLPIELHNKLKEISSDNNISMNRIIIELIKQGINNANSLQISIKTK